MRPRAALLLLRSWAWAASQSGFYLCLARGIFFFLSRSFSIPKSEALSRNLNLRHQSFSSSLDLSLSPNTCAPHRSLPRVLSLNHHVCSSRSTQLCSSLKKDGSFHFFSFIGETEREQVRGRGFTQASFG